MKRLVTCHFCLKRLGYVESDWEKARLLKEHRRISPWVHGKKRENSQRGLF